MKTFFLVIVSVLSLAHNTISSDSDKRLPVMTIQSSDGDVIDCVERASQPAFDNPLLRDHIFQEAPSELPNQAEHGHLKWQVWHHDGIMCPENTIPIRRFHKNAELPKMPYDGHEYVIGTVNNTEKIFGTKATMNVWNPKIEENVDEFSLGQIWLTAGSYNSSDLNTIEAGWQVYPRLYFDNQPRFFIFWTRDAYNITRCYNLQCNGFIQTSSTAVIGGAISPPSSFGGNQTELEIQIWKDGKLGLWWLAIAFNNGSLIEPVGYWPTTIFTRLIDYAENVQWGGEIVNQNQFGRHTTTEMGSGYLAQSGFRKAAYMRDLRIIVNESGFVPIYGLRVGSTNQTFYNATITSHTSFYYGGPQRSIAVPYKLDIVLVFVFLSMLLVCLSFSLGFVFSVCVI